MMRLFGRKNDVLIVWFMSCSIVVVCRVGKVSRSRKDVISCV